MVKITKTDKGCLTLLLKGCLPTVILIISAIGIVVYLHFRPYRHEQFIEPLNLYYCTQKTDTSIVVNFGKDMNQLSNIYEIPGASYYYLDNPLLFMVRNHNGVPQITDILVLGYQFKEFHLPDFQSPECRVSFVVNPYVIFRDLKQISPDSLHRYESFFIRVGLAYADKGVDYTLYSLDDDKSNERYIESQHNNAEYYESFDSKTSRINRFYAFSRLRKMKLELDYKKGIEWYGAPARRRQTFIGKSNRKELIQNRWLFVDTMNLGSDITVEEISWELPPNILTVIYRVDNDSILTPINGALYDKDIEVRDIFYQ